MKTGLLAGAVLLFGLQWSLFAVLDILHGYAIPVVVSLCIIGVTAFYTRQSGLAFTSRGAETR